MQHIWSVICSKSIIDKDTNVISLIEVIERISFSTEGSIGVLPAAFHVVSFWSRGHVDEPEKSFTRVIVKSPEGKHLLDDTAEIEVNLQDHRRFRSIMRFQGIPFAGNGTYQIVVQSRATETDNWKDETAVPLELINEYSPEVIEDSQAK